MIIVKLFTNGVLPLRTLFLPAPQSGICLLYAVCPLLARKVAVPALQIGKKTVPPVGRAFALPPPAGGMTPALLILIIDPRQILWPFALQACEP